MVPLEPILNRDFGVSPLSTKVRKIAFNFKKLGHFAAQLENAHSQIKSRDKNYPIISIS
jgi:hypothetical protein